MYRENDYPITVPTNNNGIWVEDTVFNTQLEFKEFLLGLFKEPGKYEFDETIDEWQAQALHYKDYSYYSNAPFKSKDFIEYWEDQKNKSRKGVIFKNNNKTWYLTRDYYFWINFLPIFDKEKGIYDFPLVWDVQYHIALFELLAELFNKHVSMLKKRQIASSYFHTGKLINFYWFEEGAKLKMGASLKDYINDKGSWKMLREYSDFLNEHTAWYRPSNPGKVMDWEQKILMTINGRDIYKGLKSTLTGHTFEKDPTAGVGGPCRIFFHEEGGIAPKADETYEFMRPALHSGMVTTGLFIIAGSVGDLDQCEPLKEYILHPEENDFYSVESNLIDEEGTWGRHGLFIPEQWSMPPYIDEFGNSLVEEALDAIHKQREEWKKNLAPDKYQLRISQKPTNIKEAFAFRKASKFAPHLLTAQARRIENREYGYEYLDLKRGKTNEIIVSKSNKQPITEFPIRRNEVDKEGTIVVWERPVKNPQFGMYYGSIDPVGEGKTSTSESLCSIFIYKNSVEVSRQNENGDMETFIEQGKIVASWCGRFDDINKTHERLELIIEWYNAWTLVENNISLFIQHMMAKRKLKYLVPKDQMVFLKNIGANANVFQEYGWKNTGTLFKEHMINYVIEFISEELSSDFDEQGNPKNIRYGIERIPDPMLIKEMSEYQDGLNVDRLVAFTALVSFIKIQDSNRGYRKITENDNNNLENNKDLFKLNKRPFSNLGGSYKKTNISKPKITFRNLK